MVDIVPNSQTVIGHGAFSLVYRATLKSVIILSFIFIMMIITFVTPFP